MTLTPNPVTTEVPCSQLPSEQLRARAAHARLYIIDMLPVAGAAAGAPQLLRDHYAYLFKLEAEGLLYGAGPVNFEPAGPSRDLAIVAAASPEEALRIAEGEPFHRAGRRLNSIRAHTMNEGVACYVGRAMSERAVARGDSFEPDAGTTNLSLEALTARAANVELFLIHLAPTDKPRPPEDTRTSNAHFVWLRENEMSARLMSCGPVPAAAPLPPGVWGGGLAVVATSRAEAERMASDEPSGQAGYRVLSVDAWRLDFGLAAPIAAALKTLNLLDAK